MQKETGMEVFRPMVHSVALHNDFNEETGNRIGTRVCTDHSETTRSCSVHY